MNAAGDQDKAMGYGMWQPDGSGVQPGGHVGGDIQRGGSFAIRYVRADLPGSMITRTAYPVEYDHLPGEFAVQVQTGWLVCTDPSDPGGTEVWSDYAYDDGYETYGSAAAARAAASRVATELLRDAGSHDWDGQPC
jgi:hypothetical protein